MANLYINIIEEITLVNNEIQKTLTTTTIPNINYIDARNMNCPSGSQTKIFSLSDVNGAGQFVTSSFQYGRITNLSSVPVKLMISSSNTTTSLLVSSGNTFYLSTSKITGSIDNSFALEDIHHVSIEPFSSSAQIEYYIATN